MRALFQTFLLMLLHFVNRSCALSRPTIARSAASIASSISTGDASAETPQTLPSSRVLADQRVAFILFNPHAGQGDPNDELSVIYDHLEPTIPVVVMETKKKPKDLDAQCRELVDSIQKRPESANQVQPIVIAAGGDGTVSAVANALIGTNIPLGVIPRGTANAFAVALDIPTQSLEAACDHIAQASTTRHVDAAVAQSGSNKKQENMILLAGIGWEANMVHTAQGELKKTLGQLAYVWGAVKETVAPKSFKCRLKVDSGTSDKVDIETHSITVAVVAPSASVSSQGAGEVIPDDGLLDITIQSCGNSTLQSLSAMGQLVTAAALDQPTESDNVLRFRAKELEVKCRTKQRVVIDGELYPHRHKTFKYKVLPKALNVIAPEPSAKES